MICVEVRGSNVVLDPRSWSVQNLNCAAVSWKNIKIFVKITLKYALSVKTKKIKSQNNLKFSREFKFKSRCIKYFSPRLESYASVLASLFSGISLKNNGSAGSKPTITRIPGTSFPTKPLMCAPKLWPASSKSLVRTQFEAIKTWRSLATSTATDGTRLQTRM